MERESSVSRETVQYRQCRKVAEQQDSRILREQCKDVSSRKHSTTHEKVEDSLSSATVPTPRSAANPVPTTQTASSAAPISPASPASGSGMMITQHKHGPQPVTGMHTYSELTKENLLSVTAMQLSPVAAEGDAAELLEKKHVTRPRQAKRKNVTTQSSREEENFGDKVIKDA